MKLLATILLTAFTCQSFAQIKEAEQIQEINLHLNQASKHLKSSAGFQTAALAFGITGAGLSLLGVQTNNTALTRGGFGISGLGLIVGIGSISELFMAGKRLGGQDGANSGQPSVSESDLEDLRRRNEEELRRQKEEKKNK